MTGDEQIADARKCAEAARQAAERRPDPGDFHRASARDWDAYADRLENRSVTTPASGGPMRETQR